MLGVVEIPCRVRWVVIGESAAASVAVAVVWAGGAGATFAFIARETGTHSSGAVAGTLVGAFTVKVSLVVRGDTRRTGVTIDVRVQLGLTTGCVINTVHLCVETRVEVTSWAVLTIAVQISNRSINKGCTVSANSFRAVSSKPVAVAVTLGGVTTSAMSGTVVWARSTCETDHG
jgi:hypothetical protein